ncbi:tumor protein p53-inducible nuclear protein 2 [Brienomyrus brachyistius]|uniref:tumor protein p53-inducible nuclear protein 2 n=1 Tax=Brienomyrus brachyistius TaxID=42636 RepID=UPI0020B3D317|nr:tumor protein p53-inducible nuclear protein 2 [Brienomyrus brachyistius]
MFGKLLTQMFGKGDSADVIEANTAAEEDKVCEDVYELEDGEWVIINIHENHGLALPEVDSLEDLLIEHPSMSVYKMRRWKSQEKTETKEKEKCSQRLAPDRRQVPWRMMPWAKLLTPDVHLFNVQRARPYTERRKLTRGALHRKNLAEIRFSASEKRYGHFKQPPRRVYNY